MILATARSFPTDLSDHLPQLPKIYHHLRSSKHSQKALNLSSTCPQLALPSRLPSCSQLLMVFYPSGYQTVLSLWLASDIFLYLSSSSNVWHRLNNLIHLPKIPPIMDPLWVDKHRPRSLDKLDYHPQVTDVLRQLADTNDFPHLVFYGPEGAGKKTRAYAFLAKIFGDHVFKLKEEQRILKPEGTSTTIEFSIFSTNHHIEMTPADNLHQDRHIVQHVVKQIAGIANIESKHRPFKVLIINEADKLTREAQGALRRTMEKYMNNCRMILLATNIHRLIHPIRSRCLNLRIPAPSSEVIQRIIADVAKIESSSLHQFNWTAQALATIASSSGGNLRLALVQLQASKFTKNTEGMVAPYKKEISEICGLILKEQNLGQMKKIRDMFYDLLVNCIDPQTILSELLQALLNSEMVNNFRQDHVKEIIHQASEHEKTLICGSKSIIHLESFAAQVMEQVVLGKSHKMQSQA